MPPRRLYSLRDYSVPASPVRSLNDATVCLQITQAHARTFSLASRLLPAEKRRAAYAVYAFCRIADDIVDDVMDSVVTGSDDPRAALEAYRGELQAMFSGHPNGPVFRELAWVVETYGVPPDPLFELLGGVERDLSPSSYATWNELAQYCEGVASSVGEACTYVFGAAETSTAVCYARQLGLAMQLTNILRDIGEDARRGRCYVPVDGLARFGFSTQDVLQCVTPDGLARAAQLPRDPAWKAYMASEVERARSLYLAARPGIALLQPDAQRCASACANGYAAILDAIEAQGYDTITSRARIGRLVSARILWSAWRHRSS